MLPAFILLAVNAMPCSAQVTSQYGVAADCWDCSSARQSDRRRTSARNGIAVGVEGHYNKGPLRFDASIRSRGVVQQPGCRRGRDLSPGTDLVPWLKAQLGRHIRSIVIDDITERWSMWEVRLRAQGEVWSPASQAYGVHSYAQIWGALAGSVDVPGDFGSGRGIEGGLLVRFSESPLAARLGYRVERGTTSGGVRKGNDPRVYDLVRLGPLATRTIKVPGPTFQQRSQQYIRAICYLVGTRVLLGRVAYAISAGDEYHSHRPKQRYALRIMAGTTRHRKCREIQPFCSPSD